MTRYRIGEATRREEDDRLLRGRGRYLDDVVCLNQTHAYFLRSSHAHASINTVDISEAANQPGVLLVLTGEDYLDRGLGRQVPVQSFKRRDGTDGFVTPQPLLAIDRVRHIGEQVVLVVAETIAQAKDAAELIEVDYEPLPAVTSVLDATEAGAPLVFEECPDNEAYFFSVGSEEEVSAQFEKADHIVQNRLVINRITANSIEPRGCLAEYDPDEDRYTLRATIQSPFRTRATLARQIFDMPLTKIRVFSDQVGGGFGMKGNCYPEYALTMWASEILRRPVKWTSERGEGIMTDDQARDNISDAELALDRDGKFLGFRVRTLANIGAYYTSDRASGPTTGNLGSLAGTYTTPFLHVEVSGILTNTTLTGHYRGAGRPEAAYVMEATIDKAARQLGIDPVEIRRINTISANDIPYKTGLVFTYDSGDFEKNLCDCVANSDYVGFPERRTRSEASGKLRGIGITNTIERTAGGMIETAQIRFDIGGTMTLLMGTSDHGQGHRTTFKQIVSERLGIEPENILYRDSDSDLVQAGTGTFGSRSAPCGSAAIELAINKIIDKGKFIVAHLLEAAVGDIAFKDGTYSVAGTDRCVDIVEVAKAAFQPAQLPPGLEPGFYETGTFSGGEPTFPNGCHICEVEIDRWTGKVSIVSYTVVDDVGTVLNPLLLKGQIHGGIAQGLGQALMEDIAFDAVSGQLLTGSFMDYAMPRADDFCTIQISSNEIPTSKNPLGVKGAGEAGTVGSLPAVMNAVNDALASIGGSEIDMPATAENVWRAIQKSNDCG